MKMSRPWAITVEGPRIDWKTMRDRIDLAAVVTRHLGPALKRRGRRLYWRCPFHEDHDPSFVVDPVKKRWNCYPCGIGGDAPAFVMRHGGMTFPEAVTYLDGGPAPARPGKAASRPRAAPRAEPRPEPSGMPEADALALVEAAAARLWNSEGADALTYLTGPRGLAPATIRAARIGWTPGVMVPTREGDHAFPALGWVLPWFAPGRLVLVKIRQPDGRPPKYAEAFRDPARLVCYPGPETIRPGRPLVIVEGEFDALCLGEALEDLAAVVTLGSASARPGPAALGPMLAASP
jgi:DNA primase